MDNIILSMKILGVLLIALLVTVASSLRILKGKDIPLDFAIGRIATIDAQEGKRIFFKSMDTIIGWINRQTGVLEAVYELQQGEKILTSYGTEGVVISKGHDINLFLPKAQEYIKLKCSQFLNKQTFNKITAFKRFFNYEYILTDQFLLKAINPYSLHTPTDAEKQKKLTEDFEIIAKKQGEKQTYFDLIMISDPKFQNSAVGLVIVKEKGNKKELCIRKMFVNKDKIKQQCIDIQTQQKLKAVIEVGTSITVIYQTYKLILDHKMRKLHQLKLSQKVSFFQQLQVIGDSSAAKNLASNSQGHTLTFFIQGNPKGSYNLEYFDKYMLVKNKDKIIANIAKNVEDKPTAVWGFTLKSNNPELFIIVEFQKGKIDCYQINQAQKNAKKIWNLTVKDHPLTVDSSKGEQKNAEQVDLQEEQKIIEKAVSQNGSEKQNVTTDQQIGSEQNIEEDLDENSPKSSP